MWDGGGHWVVWMEWHPAEWSVCLSLLIFPCTIKSRSSLLASTHPRVVPEKGRKTVVAVVVVCNMITNSLEATSVNYDRLFTELIAHGASTTTTA